MIWKQFLYANRERKIRGIISTIFYAVVLPNLLAGIAALFTLPLTGGDFEIARMFLPFAATLATIAGTVLTCSRNYLENYKEYYEQKTMELSASIEKYMSKANITFEAGIFAFDNQHLYAFHRILDQLNRQEGKIQIYAIDNTEPKAWWSDTMIGYLALLSRLKPEITVHRIFVCKKDELLSPVFVKTVGLHSLMGFKTYVTTLEKYQQAIDGLELAQPLAINREVFIWVKNNMETMETVEDSSDEPFIEITFSLGENHSLKTWERVKCFQSYWKVDSEYHLRDLLRKGKRNNEIQKYYGGVENYDEEKLWFQFIAKAQATASSNKEKAWREIPKQHLKIIRELLSKMVCCESEDKVPHDINQFSGIEIKTASNTDADCPRGNGFDSITPMSKVGSILERFHRELTKN